MFNNMSRLFSLLAIVLAVLCQGILDTAFAGPSTSASYILSMSTIDSGGGGSASTTYSFRAQSVGKGVVGTALSGNYKINSGFVATIGRVVPAVLSVSVPGNGTYAPSQTMDFTILFDDVIVTGADSILQLILNSGSVNAVYQEKTSNSLTYRYTVQPGDSDNNGIVLSGIILNGDTIQDVVGNDADLALQNTGSAASVLVDGVAPVIRGIPASITINTDVGQNTAVTNWTEPTVTDNLNGFIRTQVTSSPTTSLDNGSAFPVGITTVVYTVSDEVGNSSTAVFTVTVNDNEAPVLNGMPANIVTNTDPGQSTAVVNWTTPTVTDNVDGPIAPVVSSSPTTGLDSGSAFPVGTTTVTCTATDTAGNSASASFAVTVIDGESPVFSGVPADITVTTTSSSRKTAVVIWTAPTVMDNVDGNVTPLQTAGLLSGFEFPVGVSTILYTATDSIGNSSTESFTVTVIQREFPWLILIPELVSPHKISGSGQ